MNGKPKLPRGMFFDPAQIPMSLMEPSNEAGQAPGGCRMTSSLPDASAVRRALERRDLVYGLTVTQVMSIVVPVLDEWAAEHGKMAAEITRLETLTADLAAACAEGKKP